MIEEIKDSIWKVTSDVAGPTVAVLGGTHGNERTGVELVKKMVEQFKGGKRALSSGTLFLVLGNLKAIEMNERGSGDHRDLNRQFSKERMEAEPDGTYEDGRMREMAPILERCDISLDIHAANKPSEPFLACASSKKHDLVTRWFTTEKILTDPERVLGGAPVTTDEYVDELGGVGVCYETGLATDTSRVDEVIEDVLRILRDQKMIDDGVALPEPRVHEKYELVESIILTEKGFEFMPEKGEGSFEAFKSGESIGRHGDVDFSVDYEGVVIFPKVKAHWKVGQPVGFLARKV